VDSLQIALLACVQGLAEFLPISSSAHLILIPLLFGLEPQDLAFDVAVRLGTLAAVIFYFRRELLAITGSMLRAVAGKGMDRHARLGWMIVIATLPLLVLGLPLKLLLELLRQDPQILAVMIAGPTIGFGLLLWFADLIGTRRRDEYALNWRAALIIGCFQAFAMIPGTSRSGASMTAGLFLGLTRQATSRFAFLLAIPSILLAALIAIRHLLETAEPVNWLSLGLGALLSFVLAYISIHLFLRFIERIGMLPFVIYRLLLGGLILMLALMF
jgi:undecaprenyl-diphosphatase